MKSQDVIEQIIASKLKYPLWNEWINGSILGVNSYSIMFQAVNINNSISNSSLIYTLISKNSTDKFKESKEIAINEVNNEKLCIEQKIVNQLKDCSGVLAFDEELLLEIYTDEAFFGYLSIIRVVRLYNLYELVKTEALIVNDAFVTQFLQDTCKALKSVLQKGIPISEIKLHDIFLSSNLEIIIGHIENYYYFERLTSNGLFSSFISPELISEINAGKSSTQASMIYSLGVCLYQLVNIRTSSKIDERLTSPSYDIYSNDIHFISLYKASPPQNVSKYCYSIILKMVNSNPAERYNSIENILSDLNLYGANDQLLLTNDISELTLYQFYNNIYPIISEKISESTNMLSVNAHQTIYQNLSALGFTEGTSKKRESKKLRFVIVSILTTIMICGIIIIVLNKSNSTPIDSDIISRCDLTNDGTIDENDYTVYKELLGKLTEKQVKLELGNLSQDDAASIQSEINLLTSILDLDGDGILSSDESDYITDLYK